MSMDKKQAAAFERKVKGTIEKYKLLTKKDRVLVACSGGKDSTAVLYILHKLGYDVEALAIDLHLGDYSEQNIKNVKRFCKKHDIKLHIADIIDELGVGIRDIESRGRGMMNGRENSTCMVCGVVKRWILNKKAKEFKATKLATGHNLNDESETVLMNLLKGNPEMGLGMGPMAGAAETANKGKGEKYSNTSFVRRIKPLYFCSNEEVRAYSEYMGFPVVYSPCPCSANVFRRRIRNELKELENNYPDIRLRLVNNFLKMLPGLRKKYSASSSGDNGKGGKIGRCELCGEPSRNRVCRLCSLIDIKKSR